MKYKELLLELQKFTEEHLNQEVFVEIDCDETEETFLCDSFKEFKVIGADHEYYDRIGQIYLV